MKEIQVPGSLPADNRPAMRWSVEMDEGDACKEVLTKNYVEDIEEFIRGEARESILMTARRHAKQLQEGNNE
jgi:hypothetical protein